MMKYIMIKDCEGIHPIVFSSELNHKFIAEAIVDSKQDDRTKIISAGFFMVYEKAQGGFKYKCSGESITLGLRPGAQDTKIMAKHFSL